MSVTGHNLAVGGNCAWFSCPEVGPNGPCTGKAKVAYETVEHNDGKKEFLYHYEWVSGHEEHAKFHIPDVALAITEKARTQMKKAVSSDPWTPVGKSRIQYSKSQVNHDNKLSFFANVDY